MPDWVMLVAVVGWTVSGLCGWALYWLTCRERDDAIDAYKMARLETEAVATLAATTAPSGGGRDTYVAAMLNRFARTEANARQDWEAMRGAMRDGPFIIDELANLTPDQWAYVRTLINERATEAHLHNEAMGVHDDHTTGYPAHFKPVDE